MDKLLENLKNIGFTGYEAKVYVALLKKNPATGYEVSKLANVPQSRTYDTLKTLEQKNIIVCSNTKPVQYSPINPKKLLQSYKKEVNSTIDFLDKHLSNLSDNKLEPIINLSEEMAIKSKIIEMIRNAQKDIYLEIWAKDFVFIEEELKSAYNRNIEIRIVGFDNLKANFGLVYNHPFSKNIENHLKARSFVMTVDSKECAIGHISLNEDSEHSFLYTQNPLIVELTIDFITHDMYMLDIQENLLNEMKYTYGKGLKHLHDKILGMNNFYN